MKTDYAYESGGVQYLQQGQEPLFHTEAPSGELQQLTDRVSTF